MKTLNRSGHSTDRSLRSPKPAHLKSRAVSLLLTFLLAHRTLNSSLPWSLQPRQPLTLTSPTSPSLWESMGSWRTLLYFPEGVWVVKASHSMGRSTFAQLGDIHPIYPKQVLLHKEDAMVLEPKILSSHQFFSQLLTHTEENTTRTPKALTTILKVPQSLHTPLQRFHLPQWWGWTPPASLLRMGVLAFQAAESRRRSCLP